jgi:hypothetical protein
VTERENSFIVTNAGGKEYIFTPTIDKEECTMWKNAIFYALKKVKIFADNLAVSGNFNNLMRLQFYSFSFIT